MNFFQIQKDVTTVVPDTIFTVAGWPITNSLLMSFLILILFAVLGVVVSKTFKVKPGAFQNLLEAFYEGMYNLVKQITGGERRANAIFPLISALFFYIGVANLLPLVPGFSSFEVGGMSLFRTPTSDFNTTFALAAAMLILIQIVSVKEWGLFGYIGRFFKFKEVIQGFKKGFGAGMMAIVDFLIGLLDIIAELAKVVSLSFRLFGNMFAGEVLAILLLGAFAYFVPALWLSLNILFAVVQAVVFGALVAAYYMLAVNPGKGRKVIISIKCSQTLWNQQLV